MLRIAVTGPSGSGKGYICSILEKKGVSCLDSDKVVHRIYRDDSFAKELSLALAADVCALSGGVDRGRLRSLVFSDPKSMKMLQSLIYPRVREECLSFLALQEQRGAKAAAVDAPMLFEAGIEKDYQLIISVVAPIEERIERIIKRDSITREMALERAAHQMTEEEYGARSHAVIQNGLADDPERTLLEVLGRYGVSV